MAWDKHTKQLMDKKEREAREAARAARRAAAAHSSNGNSNGTHYSIGDVRSALKDYWAKPGTSSAHVFHTAVKAEVVSYDALERAPYNLPTPAVSLLLDYATASKDMRKGISLNLDRSVRQNAIATVAQKVGLQPPTQN